jgi:hypothetical protein
VFVFGSPEEIAAAVEATAPRPKRAPRIELIRSSFRRAFLPGQAVPLEGTVPEGCVPTLRVDGDVVGRVEPDANGEFATDVDTSELAPGYHVADVLCGGDGVLESGFYVATPQSSSATLSVALVVLLALGALGWVGVRELTRRVGQS